MSLLREVITPITMSQKFLCLYWLCFYCLGPEIRSVLDERVAHLYYVLDQGFCPEAWLLPSCLHFLIPKLRRRDAAHKEMKQIFYDAITKRRQSGEKGEDMLQTLLDTPYKYVSENKYTGLQSRGATAGC